MNSDLINIMEGKLSYKWIHSKIKDFSEQKNAYIVLSGRLYFGQITKDYWEHVMYFLFTTEDGEEFDLDELDSYERNQFTAWGYCEIEKPQLEPSFIKQLIGG